MSLSMSWIIRAAAGTFKASVWLVAPRESESAQQRVTTESWTNARPARTSVHTQRTRSRWGPSMRPQSSWEVWRCKRARAARSKLRAGGAPALRDSARRRTCTCRHAQTQGLLWPLLTRCRPDERRRASNCGPRGQWRECAACAGEWVAARLCKTSSALPAWAFCQRRLRNTKQTHVIRSFLKDECGSRRWRTQHAPIQIREQCYRAHLASNDCSHNNN